MKRIFILLLFFYFTFYNNCTKAQSVGPFYGMAYFGGAKGNGLLFNYYSQWGKDSTAVSISFPSENPTGSIMQALNGQLYGMTPSGGTINTGILFAFNAQTGKDSTLLNFVGNNGGSPWGNLIQGKDSLLYGMTSAGGANNLGTLFSFNLISGSQVVLYNFDSTHGVTPYGSLIQDTTGLLYGMASAGGKYKLGTLFCFNPVTLKDTVLVNFNDTAGSSPWGNLILVKRILYGMTKNGGTSNLGTLFKYDLLKGSDSVLINFNGTSQSPYGSLLLASDSMLYGMTSGSTIDGALFRYNPKTCKDTILLNFNGPLGNKPMGSLIQASDGLLYGMTEYGGIHNYGVIYSYNLTSGKDSVRVNFNGTGGAYPYGDITEIMYANIAATDSNRCFGDSNTTAKINIQGAKMPVSYLWSNGNTTDSVWGLKGGVYSCKVTDARGITIEVYDTVKQPAQILPHLVVTNGCFGSYGTAQVSPTGGTGPLNYIWNNKDTTAMIDSLKPGSDTCFIIDSKGCSVKAIAIIQQAQPLKIDSIVSTKTGCPGCSNGSVTVYVSGGIPPGDSIYYYYNWGNGFDSATIHNIDTGMYSVCVYSPYGCTAGGVCDSTQVVAGIQTMADISNNVNLYPVPSSGNIYVLLNGTGYEDLELNDEFGREVLHQPLNAQTYNKLLHIDLSEYTNGIYILRLLNKKGIVTKKVVLQK